MAFLLFPHEVWEIILGQLYDSGDILRTFRAFPELEREGVLRRTRHLWLFDQVIPHIFPWLKQNEFLAFRQICTQWSWGVDNFLENHPAMRAYNPSDQPTGQHWIPNASRAHYQLERHFRGLSVFSRTEEIAKFIRDMDGHTPERSPFVGRSLSISDRFIRSSGMTSFWDKVGNALLTRFGHHVWFISITLGKEGDVRQLCQRLLHCLSKLPHLKSLSIHNHYHLPYVEENDHIIGEFLNSRKGPPPQLPQLETIQFLDNPYPPSLVHFLVMDYSTQVRRLSFPAKFWRGEYSNLFPQLGELHLRETCSGKQVTGILSNLNSPQLHRLEVNLPRKHREEYSILSDIVLLLTRFPRLESLSFDAEWGEGIRGWIYPPEGSNFSIPSLKSLVIWDEGCSSYMDIVSLKCFPNLEYLKIATDSKMKFVFKLLPRLRELTVPGKGFGVGGRKVRTFVRKGN